MWGRRNTRDLDAWASALGARNDADAIAKLRSLDARLDGVLATLTGLMKPLPEGGKLGTPTGDVRAWIATSMEGLYEAKDDLATMTRAFARHERGES